MRYLAIYLVGMLPSTIPTIINRHRESAGAVRVVVAYHLVPLKHALLVQKTIYDVTTKSPAADVNGKTLRV